MGVLDEPGEEVFLQRLAGHSSATPERRVHVFGHILDLDARHSASVAPSWRYNARTGAAAPGGAKLAPDSASRHVSIVRQLLEQAPTEALPQLHGDRQVLIVGDEDFDH